jgi:hypothetical protein
MAERGEKGVEEEGREGVCQWGDGRGRGREGRRMSVASSAAVPEQDGPALKRKFITHTHT